MKLRIVSDLHLEFGNQISIPNTDKETILILAGDIFPWKQYREEYIAWIDEHSKKFKHIILVPGNHEFYRGDTLHDSSAMRLAFKKYKNVHYLNNNMVNIDGVTFIGAMLWTDMNHRDPHIMLKCQFALNDFNLISVDNKRLTPEIWCAKNRSAKKFIEKILTTFAENKTVVVTHMLPTFSSIADVHIGDPINYAFANDMDELIIKTKPNLWIHGHTHYSFDYMLENTRIICNPRGYCPNNMNPEFNDKLEVEI